MFIIFYYIFIVFYYIMFHTKLSFSYLREEKSKKRNYMASFFLEFFLLQDKWDNYPDLLMTLVVFVSWGSCILLPNCICGTVKCSLLKSDFIKEVRLCILSWTRFQWVQYSQLLALVFIDCIILLVFWCSCKYKELLLLDYIAIYWNFKVKIRKPTQMLTWNQYFLM